MKEKLTKWLVLKGSTKVRRVVGFFDESCPWSFVVPRWRDGEDRRFYYHTPSRGTWIDDLTREVFDAETHAWFAVERRARKTYAEAKRRMVTASKSAEKAASAIERAKVKLDELTASEKMRDSIDEGG